MVSASEQGAPSSASLINIRIQEKNRVEAYSPCCDFAYLDDYWLPTLPELPPSYKKARRGSNAPSVALTIEKTIDSLNAKLRDLSCKIHGKLQTPVATNTN